LGSCPQIAGVDGVALGPRRCCAENPVTAKFRGRMIQNTIQAGERGMGSGPGETRAARNGASFIGQWIEQHSNRGDLSPSAGPGTPIQAGQWRRRSGKWTNARNFVAGPGRLAVPFNPQVLFPPSNGPPGMERKDPKNGERGRQNSSGAGHEWFRGNPDARISFQRG